MHASPVSFKSGAAAGLCCSLNLSVLLLDSRIPNTLLCCHRGAGACTHTFSHAFLKCILVLGHDDKMFQNCWRSFQNFFLHSGYMCPHKKDTDSRREEGQKRGRVPPNWNSFFIFFLSRLNANVSQAAFVEQNQQILFPWMCLNPYRMKALPSQQWSLQLQIYPLFAVKPLILRRFSNSHSEWCKFKEKRWKIGGFYHSSSFV